MKPAAMLLVVGMAACAAPGQAEPGPAPAHTAMPADLPADGGGTLRFDQITVEIRTGALLVRLTPLDEAVLRLTAPDTQRRLRALGKSGAESHESGAGSRFLVSFHTSQPGTRFEPESVAVESGGVRLRPSRIVPLTPGWSDHRLGPQAAESAIYVFDREVPPMQPFTARYGGLTNERWREILPLLRAEEARLPIMPPARTP